MKQDKFIRKCGPFRVVSRSYWNGEVHMDVYPRFPQYDDWPERRKADQGGGPGLFTSIALAEALEAFLNQPYSEADVLAWKVRIDRIRASRGREGVRRR